MTASKNFYSCAGKQMFKIQNEKEERTYRPHSKLVNPRPHACDVGANDMKTSNINHVISSTFEL